MDWNAVLQQIIAVMLPIVAGVVAIMVKRITKSMQDSDNAIVHTIGELAYREVERQLNGVGGAEKMTAALKQARSRLDQSGRLSSVSDEQIIAAIQKAWMQNEGQYK